MPEPTPTIAGSFSDDACDPGCMQRGRTTIVWSMIAAASLVASTATIKLGDPSPGWTLLIGMLPIPALAAMYWAMFRTVRRADEMQRQKTLEALGLTVIVSSLILFSMGQFQRVGLYEASDFSDAWIVITFAYLACYGLVALRYRA